MIIISSKPSLHDLANDGMFNGKRLVAWKHGEDALLHFVGSTYVIESDLIPKPTNEASKEDQELYAQWKSDNKSRRHLLLGFISSDLVKQFEHFTTTNEIYNFAIKKYIDTPKSHLMEAFGTYFNHKILEGTSIRDHIDKMAARHNNLATLVKEMDKDFQILYLLLSLPPSSENVS